MLDERVEPVAPELRHRAFNNKTVGQRAAIIAAGPVANFIFAIFAYWLVFIIGVRRAPGRGRNHHGFYCGNGANYTGMELKAIDGIETLIGMP